MRLWILGAALIIVRAINPEVTYETTLSIFLIILFVGGSFMDAIEFLNKWK